MAKEKLTKEQKNEMKAQKKAERKANGSTPEAMETKQTIIKAATAVICVVALCLSSTSAIGKYCEALTKTAEFKGTSVSASGDNGAAADSSSSYVDTSSDTAAPSDDTAAPADDTAAPSDDTAAPADSSSGDSSASTPASTDSGKPAGGNSAAVDPNAKGLNSTDPAAVAAFYNKAVHATEKSAPKGHQTMKLDGGITGDGALGAVLKVASPIIEDTLARNSTDTDYIPGHEADLLASDIKSCSAVSKGGVTTLTIQLKDQKDGPEADAHTAGPVARGIGTLGNVNGAIEELGAELYSGRETIALNYNDAYIKQLTIDENTGKITHGTWHYKVNVTVGNAEIKLGLKFTAKNLKACIDYTVAI